MINKKGHIPKLISSSSSSSSNDLCSIIKPDDGNSCAYTNNNAKNNFLNLLLLFTVKTPCFSWFWFYNHFFGIYNIDIPFTSIHIKLCFTCILINKFKNICQRI